MAVERGFTVSLLPVTVIKAV